MPGERLTQQVGGVLTQGAFARACQIVAQGGAEVGVGAFFNDDFRPLCGRVPAQVGQALFGDQNLHVVLGVVHVRSHGHDAGDGAVLGQRRRHEDRQVGVACEVA